MALTEARLVHFLDDASADNDAGASVGDVAPLRDLNASERDQCVNDNLRSSFPKTDLLRRLAQGADEPVFFCVVLREESGERVKVGIEGVVVAASSLVISSRRRNGYRVTCEADSRKDEPLGPDALLLLSPPRFDVHLLGERKVPRLEPVGLSCPHLDVHA